MTDPAPVRFGLHWAGKSEARARARTPTRATLAPSLADSLAFEDTEHVFIEGDNLEALKLLRRSLAGRVRLVFIDPPYNTGQAFVYPDRYADGVAAYLVRSGQVDAQGELLAANPETDGRHHSRWLDLMLPRLELARDLLADNGALFVTIDDHEVHHLRMLLDEVFGRESFVACCAWRKTFAKKNKALVSSSHDHVLIYARDIGAWQRNLWPRSEEQLTAFRNLDDDPRGRWQSVAYSVPSEDGQRRAAYRYEIETPAGNRVAPPAGRHWNGLPGRTASLRADGRLWFGRTGDRRPRLKVFLSEVQGGIVPDTWWDHAAFGHNQEAKKELLELFPDAEPFTTPKPTRLIRRILQLATTRDTGDIVVDFFAGSATTGHAVWQQNALDGGNRRFVLVQLPHPTPDPRWPTISALARARLRRAAERVDGPGDRGFRALVLSAPPADHEACPSVELQEGARMGFVVAAMVELGIDLGASVDQYTLEGHTVVSADGGRLVVCAEVRLASPVGFARALASQWGGAGRTPPMVVLREAALPTDSLRLEVVHILRQAGITGVHTR